MHLCDRCPIASLLRRQFFLGKRIPQTPQTPHTARDEGSTVVRGACGIVQIIFAASTSSKSSAYKAPLVHLGSWASANRLTCLRKLPRGSGYIRSMGTALAAKRILLDRALAHRGMKFAEGIADIVSVRPCNNSFRLSDQQLQLLA